MSPKCALPYHMREMVHGDWPWPFNRISRAWNAYGARCPEGSEGYRHWPPRLIEGRGVARWENANADSILYIPALAKRKIYGHEFYGRNWDVVEMNPGRHDFRQEKQVFFPYWESVKVKDVEVSPGKWTTVCTPNTYSPSALQKFSDPSVRGYIKLDPEYHCEWRFREQRELPWLLGGAQGKKPEDALWYFWRTGFRPDHIDTFFNKTIIVTAGMKWE